MHCICPKRTKQPSGKYQFFTLRKVPHDIHPSKALITILSFIVINNNNVDLDLIQDLDLILHPDQFHILDKYQFFLVFIFLIFVLFVYRRGEISIIGKYWKI